MFEIDAVLLSSHHLSECTRSRELVQIEIKMRPCLLMRLRCCEQRRDKISPEESELSGERDVRTLICLRAALQTTGMSGNQSSNFQRALDPVRPQLCTLWLRTGVCWSTNSWTDRTRAPCWIGKLEGVTSVSIIQFPAHITGDCAFFWFPNRHHGICYDVMITGG